NIAAKLSDVAPNGASSLITAGWARVETQGSVTFGLLATSYRVAPRHCLRLSIACADFPRFWPSPGDLQIALQHGRSHVEIPVVPLDPDPLNLPLPARPKPVRDRMPWLIENHPEWTISRDKLQGTVAVTTGGREKLNLPAGGRFHIRHRAT